MICPTCQSVTSAPVATCPVCDQPLAPLSGRAHEHRARLTTTPRHVRVVEGSISAARTIPLGSDDALPQEATLLGEGDTVEGDVASMGEALPTSLAPRHEGALVPLLRSLPALTARAWEQPAVRAAVRTGASAVAVSVATRVATRLITRWIASPGVLASSDVPSILPELAEALDARAALPSIRRKRGRHVTVETFVYLRRTIRAD